MYGSAFAACPEIDMDQNFAAADVTTACKQALGIPCNANKADDLVDPDCTFMAVQSSTGGPGFDCGAQSDQTACNDEPSCAWKSVSCVCDGLTDTEWKKDGCREGGGEPQQVHYLLQTQLCSKCLAVL